MFTLDFTWFSKVRLSEKVSEISFQTSEKTEFESLASLQQHTCYYRVFGPIRDAYDHFITMFEQRVNLIYLTDIGVC